MKKTLWVFLLLAKTVFSAHSSQLQKGDALYSAREIPQNAQQALEFYKNACTNDPTVDSLWRISMASHFVGMRYEQDPEKQKQLFKEGKEWGEKALAQDPDCVPCHFWTAVNMALYGQTVGKMKMLFSLKSIEAHLDAVIAKDPSYALAGAYRIKGIIEKSLPGILGGSNERALHYFEKAIQVAPSAVLNYSVLAQFLSEELDLPTQAHQVALAGIHIQGPDNGIESRESREELAQLEKKLLVQKF